MFWEFMHRVHGLPLFEDRDTKPWWTTEEDRILHIVNTQYTFSILLDKEEPTDVPIYKDGSKYGYLLGPTFVLEGGVYTEGLDEGIKRFFEEHLGMGKYIGSVTYSDTKPPLFCKGANDVINYLQAMIDDMKKEKRMHPTDRAFLRKIVAAKDVVDELYTNAEFDTETVWIFERGSIAYANYGRGAGFSVKLHETNDMLKGKTGTLLEQFRSL